jgi:hypothetical protein
MGVICREVLEKESQNTAKKQNTPFSDRGGYFLNARRGGITPQNHFRGDP